MPTKKPSFHIYEDGDDNEPQRYDDDVLCSPYRPSPATCGPFCPGCIHCGNLLKVASPQEPGALANNMVTHQVKSTLASDPIFQTSYHNGLHLTTSTSDTLYQIPSNNVSLASTSSGKESINTTDSATALAPPPPAPPPPPNEPQTPTSKHIRFHPSTTSTPIRPTSQHFPRARSPPLNGGKHLFHSPTRDLVDQQRKSKVSRATVKAQQLFRNSKSPSLTGSQDSLLPFYPANVGQKSSPRSYQPTTRTHAEKLRAALACPVDELPQLKPKSPKMNPLKNKVGKLWRKVQVDRNELIDMRSMILIFSNSINLRNPWS